ncbi:MAG TPA: hypothetical protein ENH28_02165 [Euryarchaeota archaeon]|nr:hypothetical protein [Euryarchaeota archaeon]
MIKTTPALAARVDRDGDGIFNEIDDPVNPEPYIDPYNMIFGIGYVNEPDDPFYYSALTVLEPGRYIRLIALMDKPQDNYMVLEVDYIDIYPGDPSYFSLASPGVINQEEGGVWQTPPTPVTTFRYGLDIDETPQPIRQHYDNGIFGCYPVEGTNPDGDPACLYPESEAIPAELSPSPIDAVYFPEMKQD